MDRVWYVLSESSLQAPPSSTGCEILFNSSRIDDPTSTAELTSQCKADQATTGLATLLPLNFLQLFFRLDTLSQLSYPSVLLSVLYGGQSVSSHTVSVQGSSMKSGPPIIKFTWVFFIMTFLLNISFSNIGQNPAICSNLFYVSSGYLSSMFPQFSADIFLRCILESTISEYDKENDTS